MAPSTEPAIVCATCLSTDFDLVGGGLVCRACGTRSDRFIEEVTEFAEGGRGGALVWARGPAVAAPRAAAAVAAGDAAAAARPRPAAFVLANVRTMQRVLKAQTTALATTLAAGPPLPALLSLTGRIWHAHLAASGLLDPSRLDSLAKVVDRPAKAATEAAFAEVVAAAAEATGRLVSPVAGPRVLLSILFLAAWVSRAPVTPVDLVRWAGRGELPFLDLSRFVPPGAGSLVCAAALLRPGGPPSPAAVIAGAARLSAALGGLGRALPTPTPAILRRWLFELGAPQALLPVALEVAQTAGQAARARGDGEGAGRADPAAVLASPADALSSDPAKYPFLGALAALAVAVKLGYGLGVERSASGGGASGGDAPPPPSLPGLPPPPPAGWAAWAGAVVAASTAAPFGTPPSAAAAAGLGREAADAYVAWLGQAVFPPPAAASTAAAPGGGGAGSGAPWEATAEALARVGRPAPPPQQQEHRPPPPPLPPHRPTAKRPHPPAAWPFAPPAHPDRLTAALPPPYAAVLAALAAHAWVKPAALHAAASRVEAALLEAEAGVEK